MFYFVMDSMLHSMLLYVVMDGSLMKKYGLMIFKVAGWYHFVSMKLDFKLVLL